jgi:hypothetical protein
MAIRRKHRSCHFTTYHFVAILHIAFIPETTIDERLMQFGTTLHQECLDAVFIELTKHLLNTISLQKVEPFR